LSSYFSRTAPEFVWCLFCFVSAHQGSDGSINTTLTQMNHTIRAITPKFVLIEPNLPSVNTPLKSPPLMYRLNVQNVETNTHKQIQTHKYIVRVSRFAWLFCKTCPITCHLAPATSQGFRVEKVHGLTVITSMGFQDF